MATGANGIATKADLNNLLTNADFWTSDTSKCPAYSEIIAAKYSTTSYDYTITVKDSYESNQLVKFSSCSLKSTGKMYTIFVNISNINATDCGTGNNPNWTYQSGGIYTLDVVGWVKFYNGNTLISQEDIDLHFEGDVDATYDDSHNLPYVDGSGVVSKSFNFGTTITKLEFGSDQSWLASIQSNRYFNIPSSNQGANYTVNWPSIVIVGREM